MFSLARSIDQRRLELLDRGRLGVDVLAGDRVLAEQRLVALQLHPAVLELGLVAHARADRLLQGDLERPRIDGREQLSLLHHLPFGEGNRGQHARDLRPHRHRDRGHRRCRARRAPPAGRRGSRWRRRRCSAPRRDRRGHRGRRAAHRRAPDAPEPAARAANGTAGRRPAGRFVRYQASAARPTSADDGDDRAEPARRGGSARLGGAVEGSSSCGSDRMQGPAEGSREG